MPSLTGSRTPPPLSTAPSRAQVPRGTAGTLGLEESEEPLGTPPARVLPRGCPLESVRGVGVAGPSGAQLLPGPGRAAPAVSVHSAVPLRPPALGPRSSQRRRGPAGFLRRCQILLCQRCQKSPEGLRREAAGPERPGEGGFHSVLGPGSWVSTELGDRGPRGALGTGCFQCTATGF